MGEEELLPPPPRKQAAQPSSELLPPPPKKPRATASGSPASSGPGGTPSVAPAVQPVEPLQTSTPIPVVEARNDLVKTPYQLEQDRREAEYANARNNALGGPGVLGKKIVNFFRDTYEQGKDVATNQIPSALKGALAWYARSNDPGVVGDVLLSDEEKALYDKTRQNVAVNATVSAIKDQQASSQKPIIRSLKEVKSPSDAVTFVGGAIASSTLQIPLTIVTGGGSAIGQEIGGAYMDQVQAIAKEKGLTPAQVIEQKLDQPALAGITGLVSGSLDAVTNLKVGKALTQLPVITSLRKRALDVLKSALLEGSTEAAQKGVVKAGTAAATGENIPDAVLSDGQGYLDEFAMGAIGGGGISALGGSASNALASQEQTPLLPPPARTVLTNPVVQSFPREENSYLSEEQSTRQDEQQSKPANEVAISSGAAEGVPESISNVPDAMVDNGQVLDAAIEEPAPIPQEVQPEPTVAEQPNPLADEPATRTGEQQENSGVLEPTAPEEAVSGGIGDVNTSAGEAGEVVLGLDDRGPQADDGVISARVAESNTQTPRRESNGSVEPNLTELGQSVKFEFSDGAVRQGVVTTNNPDGTVTIRAHNGRNYTVKPNALQATPYTFYKSSGIAQLSPNLGIVSDVLKHLPKAQGLIQRYLTSRGNLPQGVFDRLTEANAETRSITKQIDYSSRDLKRSVERAFGKKPSPQQIEDINLALRGEAPSTSLPAAIASVVSDMRNQVDALSRQLIQSGAVQGKMATKVNANLGTYLTRSYQVFDDPNYGPDKIPPQIMNQAVSFLRGQFPSATSEQLDGYIHAFLTDKSDKSPVQLIKQGKLGSKDLGILKMKKDIPVELRALMGEYNDPLLNYARSVTKMAALVANHKFLTDVRTLGLGKFLFDTGAVPPDNVHTKRIAAEGTKSVVPLNGLWTTPEIAEAFEKMGSGPNPDNILWKAYNTVNYALKYGKTVLAPVTHVRNFVSNAFVAVANGHWDIREAKTAWKTLASELGAADEVAWRDRYKKYTALGIVGEGVNAEELRNVIQDVIKKGEERIVGVDDDVATKLINGFKEKGRAVLQGAYSAEDEFWKIMGYETELARYKKAMPNTPIEEVEKIAAQNIRNTYPTYSLTPELVKQFRKTPLIGTFVSFPAEIIRTSWNIAQLARQEIKDPNLRSIGIQRLTGLGLAATMPYMINTLTQNLFGVDEEEDKELRRFKAPWAQNAMDAYVATPKDGVYQFIDMSYTDPYAYLRKPWLAILSDAPLAGKAGEAAGEVLSPFISPELLAKSIAESVFNKDYESGRDIYNPQLPVGDKIYKAITNVTKELKPGFIDTGVELYKGSTGQTNEYGKAYDPRLTFTKLLTGQKIEKLDIAENLGFKVRALQRDLIAAKQIYTSEQRKSVPEEQKEAARIKSEAAVQKLLDQMKQDVEAAIKLGVSSQDAYRLLNDARINNATLREMDVPVYSSKKKSSGRDIRR